jgi:hypothetical protein
VLRTQASADDLRSRIRAHLAGEEHPELADVHVVRSPADLHPMMPAYMVAYLERQFA